MERLKIAVVGASGYSGEELLRLLIRHPYCEIKIITSRQYAGQTVGKLFPRFAESELCFSAPDVDKIIAECDLVFLALPHGLATEFAIPFIEAGLKVIDISADFRLRDCDKYKEYYNEDHPSPDLLNSAVYGLPERYRKQIRSTNLIACAGCYPTSVILPSSPLLNGGLVNHKGIVVSSMSGVSGAGRKVDLPYIFPECNESVRAYAPVGHRHTPEIEQELAVAANVPEVAISFIPHLIPVNRGINSTIIFDGMPGCTLDKLIDTLENAYKDEPFVRVLPLGLLPDTKHVTFTNICEIGVAYDIRTNKVIVTSVIDNLTKGASGQAVQCMNIIFNFEETTGLL